MKMPRFSAKSRHAVIRLAVGSMATIATLILTTGTAGATPFVPAGYVAQLSGVTSATLDAHLTVPTITCTANTTASVDDSVSLYGTATGGGFEVAGVVVVESCSGLVPSYSAYRRSR